MWIKCNAVFQADTEVDYESLGLPTPDYEMEVFIFDPRELESFNQSSEGGTTINFKSGYRITTDLDFDTFTKLMIDDTNKQ